MTTRRPPAPPAEIDARAGGNAQPDNPRAFPPAPVEGGEYWDFFYASEADRIAQIRTPIADAMLAERGKGGGTP